MRIDQYSTGIINKNDTNFWLRGLMVMKKITQNFLALGLTLNALPGFAINHCGNNINEIASANNATHVVISSGHWSQTSTWQGGSIPGNDAVVHIPQNLTVTLDTATARLDTMRIDGTLTFDHLSNTLLQVDTLFSSPNGELHIGTVTNPIAANRTARILFHNDDGPINTSCDPSQISRGAILAGKTRMYGTAKTDKAILANPANSGNNTITLTQTPQGWNIGDELVITGTRIVNNHPDPMSDERRTIAQINGNNITLSSTLNLDHAAPAVAGGGNLNVYVANLTRNIELSSESSTIMSRAHMMLMATLDVQIHNISMTNMGRTDKRVPLDDFIFNFENDEELPGNEGGAPINFTVSTGARTNIRGRYPIHFHRGGATLGSMPAVVNGSVVNDSPGWGFVSHSSHVNFIDNVSYAVQGSGYYTEAGDEIGTMQGNIAIRSVNDAFTFDGENGAIDPDLGFDNQEFGNDGEGYWLSGPMVNLIDNVSAGTTGHGFIFWADGLVEADITPQARTQVLVSALPNSQLITNEQPTRTKIPVWWAPTATIRGNEAYGSSIGFRIRYLYNNTYLGEGGSNFHLPPPQAYQDTLETVIDDLTVWNNRDGMLLNYTSRMNIKNSLIVGYGAPFRPDAGTADAGVGLDLGTEVTRGFGRIENVRIQGFKRGFTAPRNDQWVFENLSLRNTEDIAIAEPRQSARSLQMNNVQFLPLTGTAVQGDARTHISMIANLDEGSFQPYFFLLPDHITLNGQGLYYATQQTASYIPYPMPLDEEVEPVDNWYVGKTNQQIFSNRGFAFGGGLLPDDATPHPTLNINNGLVGSIPPSATTFPPLIDMTTEGFNPEPWPGTSIPQIVRNYMCISPEQRLTLMRTNIHTIDLQSGNESDMPTNPADLQYSTQNVSNGYFARITAPNTAISQFSQAEIDAGHLQFVQQGSNAPSYQIRVSDAPNQTSWSTAMVECFSDLIFASDFES